MRWCLCLRTLEVASASKARGAAPRFPWSARAAARASSSSRAMTRCARSAGRWHSSVSRRSSPGRRWGASRAARSAQGGLPSFECARRSQDRGMYESSQGRVVHRKRARRTQEDQACDDESATTRVLPSHCQNTCRWPPKVPPRCCPPQASESCPRDLRTAFRDLSEATPAQMPPCLSVGVARTCKSSRCHVRAP